MIAYVFSPSRSSETPERVLEGTAGKLVADAYKGYDRVTLPGRRVRAGCLAHVRRKFFDAQSVAPDAAKQAMDFILEVYKIERAALDADVLGTPEHLRRRTRQEELPFRRLGRSRREPGRPLLAYRDVRGERAESRRVPRRRAAPRADAAGRAD
jgi:transposase